MRQVTWWEAFGLLAAAMMLGWALINQLEIIRVIDGRGYDRMLDCHTLPAAPARSPHCT
jgi:hypothetical protein